MNYSIPRRMIIIVTMIISVLLSSCNSPKVESIRVAYVEASSNLPFFVALERGLFDEEGLKIEMTKAANSSEALNLLAANKVDVSIENNYNVIYAMSSKEPNLLKIVNPCYETKDHPISHLLVKRNSEITSFSDLKGKKIGTFSGASQLLVLKLYLQKKLKIDPEKDITLLQVEMNLQIPSLESGQFDALFTVEPYSTVAIQSGSIISIDDYVRGEIMDPFPAGATSISKNAINNKKASVSKFISILDKAILEIKEKGTKINAILPKYTSLTKDIAESSQIYLFKTLQETTKNDEELVLSLMKLYTESDILPSNSIIEGLFLTPQEVNYE